MELCESAKAVIARRFLLRTLLPSPGRLYGEVGQQQEPLPLLTLPCGSQGWPGDADCSGVAGLPSMRQSVLSAQATARAC